MHSPHDASRPRIQPPPLPRKVAIAGMLCGSLWLSACGGGGGDSSAPPPPPAPAPPPVATALPDLDIVAPATGDLGAAVALSTSVTPAAALKTQWDFGDGTTATDAAPHHQFVRAGDLTVKLTLTNEAGTRKTYTKAISLTNKALVKGNYCGGQNDQGWCWMPPQASGNRVLDIQFADAITGWRSDEFGDIFKTTDGGKNWTRQPTGFKSSLSEILARSSSDVVGVDRASSLLLISEDGGKTWQKQSLPAMDTPYTFIHALGQGKVLIVPNPEAGLANSIAQYLDRASGSWQAVPLGQVEQMSVSPEGSILTYTAGELTRRASPLAAPQTVFNIPALVPPESNDYAALYRTNAQVVWLVRVYGLSVSGTKVLYRSVDDGQHWQAISPVIDTGFPASPRRLPVLLASDASGQKVAMAVRDYGPLSDTYTKGLWNSVDGGQTWTKQLSGFFNSLSDDLYCMPSNFNVLCIRGSASPTVTTTLLSQDYGATFTTYPGNSMAAGAAIRINPGWGPAVVTDSRLPPAPTWTGVPTSVPSFGSRKVGRRSFGGSLYGTEDGGHSWTELGHLLSADDKDTVGLPATKTIAQTDAFIYSVTMLDERTIWLTAANRIVVSRDAGATWTRPAELNQAGLYVYTPRFQDANLGWTQATQADRTSVLLVTRDGGKSWKSIGFIPISDILSVRQGTGQQITLIGTDGAVYESTNGGTTWANPGNVSAALNNFFSNEEGTVYWAVGEAGSLFKSADKGVSWQKTQLSTSAALKAVCFADGSNGWVAGNAGEIWTTGDGGASWRKQTTPTSQDFASLNCQDSRTVWAAGAWGLLATGTGGE